MADPYYMTFRSVGPLEQASQAVYVRTSWDDPWVLVSNLHCDGITWAASPSIGTATFSYRYGPKLQSGLNVWQAIARFAPNPRSYVRVVVTPTEGGDPDIPMEWLGIWRQAVDSGLAQRFSADSLEALLSFTTIRDAWYYDVFGAIRRAAFGMTFNDGGRKNRSASKHAVRATGQCYVFDADESRAEYWSTRDIVEYLLEAHPPTREDDTTIFSFGLHNPERLPDYDRPTMASHGKDVLMLLQALISRYRMLSFRPVVHNLAATAYVAAQTAVYLEPFTFSESAISLSGIVTDPDDPFFRPQSIPANERKFRLDFTRDPSSSASLSIMASHVADRVTVIGGRRLIVCSLSKADGSLDKGWSGSQEAKYRSAESTLGDDLPTSTERGDREAAVKQLRAGREYEHVFARFRIPKYWDQKTKDGEGAGDAVAIAEVDGGTAQYYIPQHVLAIQRDLPLLSGYDYADTILADAEAEYEPGHRGTKVGEPPHERLPILVVAKSPAGGALPWVDAMTLSQKAAVELCDYEGLTPAAQHWSAQARVIEAGSAIQLDIDGEQNHILAADEFADADDGIPGAYRWQDLILTVAIQDPRQMRVSYPADEDLAPIGEFLNEKVLEVGDEYQQIYVQPNTVVGVDKAGDLVRSTGGYLQDDRDYFMLLAQRAYAWHSTPRYALQFATGLIDGRLSVGALITEIRDQNRLLTVGSVVTEVTITFPRSRSTQAPTPKVMYCTAFGELDPTSFF